MSTYFYSPAYFSIRKDGDEFGRLELAAMLDWETKTSLEIKIQVLNDIKLLPPKEWRETYL